MEKKFYVNPSMKMVDLEPESMLAGSEGDGGAIGPDAPFGTQKKSMWDNSESKIWK